MTTHDLARYFGTCPAATTAEPAVPKVARRGPPRYMRTSKALLRAAAATAAEAVALHDSKVTARMIGAGCVVRLVLTVSAEGDAQGDLTLVGAGGRVALGDIALAADDADAAE